MTVATVPHAPADLFRAEDRCDRSSAAARVLALLHTGGKLVFCRHHANEFRTGLEPIALIVEHQEHTA